jgi:hypothetical protein
VLIVRAYKNQDAYHYDYDDDNNCDGGGGGGGGDEWGSRGRRWRGGVALDWAN